MRWGGGGGWGWNQQQRKQKQGQASEVQTTHVNTGTSINSGPWTYIVLQLFPLGEKEHGQCFWLHPHILIKVTHPSLAFHTGCRHQGHNTKCGLPITGTARMRIRAKCFWIHPHILIPTVTHPSLAFHTGCRHQGHNTKCDLLIIGTARTRIRATRSEKARKPCPNPPQKWSHDSDWDQRLGARFS